MRSWWYLLPLAGVSLLLWTLWIQGTVWMSEVPDPPEAVVCPGGVAEPTTKDASRCPSCSYTFTTVPYNPQVVPPHWKQ